MKRLLAGGSGDIYQICRVFRDDELGRWHQPEFTLLEWYRVGCDHHRLMDEVETLVRRVLAPDRSLGPVVRLTYAQAFEQSLALDVHTAGVAALRALAQARGLLSVDLGEGIDAWRDLLWTHLIEPGLPPAAFVYAYPASQAALARVSDDDPPVAERFELYLDGIEIANGFHELTDPAEQRRRFDADNRVRRDQGQAAVPVDERLLAALAQGLPDCAGVALGVDRLLMAASGACAIRQVLAFPVDLA
jgi:lysyl-tRNA synthetase class 2